MPQSRIEHITIPLDFMHRYFVSSLLSGAEEIPEGNYDDEKHEIDRRPVPQRHNAFPWHAVLPNRADLNT